MYLPNKLVTIFKNKYVQAEIQRILLISINLYNHQIKIT